MPLPLSGIISLSNIQTEFGGTNPISFSEYYSRGLYVGNNAVNVPNVPTSGAIRFSDFYGAANPVPVIVTGSFSSATVGTDKIITFIGSGTFTPTSALTVRLLVIGGGAGGDYRFNAGGGGGGGGGIQEVTITLAANTTYNITVGQAGVGNAGSFAAASGGSSSFTGYTSTGGLPAGWGQGFDFGRGGTPNGVNGGALGGTGIGGTGRTGYTSDISGSNYVYGSGGGGGGGAGGLGGTGAGKGGNSYEFGTPATNYGAGGGGGGYYRGGTYYYGGNGFQGVVIVRGFFV